MEHNGGTCLMMVLLQCCGKKKSRTDNSQHGKKSEADSREKMILRGFTLDHKCKLIRNDRNRLCSGREELANWRIALTSTCWRHERDSKCSCRPSGLIFELSLLLCLLLLLSCLTFRFLPLLIVQSDS